MSNGFILEGIKYVGTNLISGAEDIFVQGKDIFVKACAKQENVNINAKKGFDHVTTIKIMSVSVKVLVLILAIPTAFSLATTMPAVAITYLVGTALKVTILFFAADLVEVDDNTFGWVKVPENTVNESVKTAKSLVSWIPFVGVHLSNAMDWTGEQAKKLMNDAQNQTILATIHAALLLGSERQLGDTDHEAVLRNASKGTYIIRHLVNGMINCGRCMKKHADEQMTKNLVKN